MKTLTVLLNYRIDPGCMYTNKKLHNITTVAISNCYLRTISHDFHWNTVTSVPFIMCHSSSITIDLNSN